MAAAMNALQEYKDLFPELGSHRKLPNQMRLASFNHLLASKSTPSSPADSCPVSPMDLDEVLNDHQSRPSPPPPGATLSSDNQSQKSPPGSNGCPAVKKLRPSYHPQN